jgi:hypothetical protein
LATIAAVCAVQSLYYNAVLLFAIGTACMIVGIRRRQWKRVAMVAGVGLIAAITVLPYFGTVNRVRQWNMLIQIPFSGHRLWSKLCVPLGAQGQFMIWVWLTLVGLAMITAMVAQIRRLTPDLSDERRDLALFGGSALVIGLLGYIAFLKVLSYDTGPWYYLALMVFIALAIEVVLSIIFTRWPARLARILLVAIVVILSVQSLRQSLQVRQTNIDLIAANVGKNANQNDLIIINGWVMSANFDRHFKGNTPWMTIPPIHDHKLHRYDLIKELMLTPQPLQPLLEAIRRTLQSGHRLWIVGLFPAPPPGQAPQSLPPPPLPGSGWNESPYDYAWSLEVGYFIQSHATNARVEKFGEVVAGYENPRLEVVEGWQSDSGK